MPFRLTYALTDSDIILVELESDGDTFGSMVEKATEYILTNHGDDALEKVKGISLLKL